MNSSRFFDEEVLACPHCGWQPDNGISRKLLRFLDKLQKQIDEPLSIACCARCEEYNDLVHGYEDSYHIKGKAVDINVPDDMYIDEFADICEECGAEGIVLKYDENIVHVDMRGQKKRYEE